MDEDYVRLASSYLKLWKLVDLYFPGHQWLEISEESEDSLLSDVQTLVRDGTSEGEELRRDAVRTLSLLARKVDLGWLREATYWRAYLQNQGLMAAEKIRETMDINPEIFNKFFREDR